jgi:hypothetical protein
LTDKFYRVIKGLAGKLHMGNPASGSIAKIDFVKKFKPPGGYENIICEYVDAMKIIKEIKDKDKRLVIFYKAMGYQDWEIAEKLKKSERTIRRYTASIKEFLEDLEKKVS